MKFRTLGVLAVLLAIWLTMLLGGGGPLDRTVYEAIYAGHRPSLLEFAHMFTTLGEPTLLIAAGALCTVLLWMSGRGRLGMALLAVTFGGRLLSEAQKYWVARVRPDLEPHLVVVKTSSFPSGHAASSMIFYLSLTLALAPGRFRVPAAIAAILLSLVIGTTRVMLGVHWPSDVIGGWAFGFLWVLLTIGPAERLFHADSAISRTAVK